VTLPAGEASAVRGIARPKKRKDSNPARRFALRGRSLIQIDVELPDRPGELAKLAKVLSDASINIDAISAESGGSRAYVSLIVDQPARARVALKGAGYGYAERTVLVCTLEDRPGALAALAGKLGDAGVNITSVIQLESSGGRVQMAIGVDDLAKARAFV